MKSIIYLLIGFLAVAFVAAEITGSETMTRTGPSGTVDEGSSFQICYEVHGASGLWGVSYVDTISGGCTLNNGNTEIRDVMLSDATDAPGPRCANINAPASAGSCSFAGDYKFGDLDTVLFPDLTIQVGNTGCTSDWDCPTWTWSDATNQCGTGTRVCTDLNGCEDPRTETTSETCPTTTCTADSECDDSNSCTADTCSSSGTCINTHLNTPECAAACEFWESEDNGQCSFNTGILILAAVGIVALRFLK